MLQFKPGLGAVIPNKENKEDNVLRGMKLGPSYVFETEYKFDQSTILPKLEDFVNGIDGFSTFNKTLEVGQAGSSASYFSNMPHTWPEFSDFVGYAGHCAKMILDSWKIIHDEIVITRSWVNRHKRGGWTNWHSHYHADLVAAVYLKVPPKGGNLVIADPMEYQWGGLAKQTDEKYGHAHRIPVHTNKVIFLAPFVRHCTEENQSDEDRWVMSINFKSLKNVENLKEI